MNATAAAAIHRLQQMLAPRELSPVQRTAALSARAHLGALTAMVNDFNDSIAPLRGYVPELELHKIGAGLQAINKLLADDQEARRRKAA